MKNPKLITLSLILTFLFPQIGCVALHRGTVNVLTVRADKNGNKPEDIAEEFMKAARAGDYERAKIHWTADGIKKYESSSSWGGFKGYCDYLSRHPGYKISASTPSKKGVKWLSVRWYDEHGQKMDEGWSFSFRKIDDQWFITQ